jgi:hypothetical protein
LTEESIENNGRLNVAHKMFHGLLGALLFRANEKLLKYVDEAEKIERLCAVFVIGLQTCEQAILEGEYLQGLNLLRQEMELLAQIKHVANNSYVNNKSP